MGLVQGFAVSRIVCRQRLQGEGASRVVERLCCYDGRYSEGGGGRGRAESRGVFVVLHGIVRSSYIAPDGTEIVRL